jgi:heme O synthase-like polyprenyltransferase
MLDKKYFKNCNILKFGTLMNLTKKIENKKTLHLYKIYQLKCLPSWLKNVTPSNNFLGNCNGIRTVLMIWVSVASNFSFNTVLLTDTQYDVS